MRLPNAEECKLREIVIFMFCNMEMPFLWNRVNMLIFSCH